MSKPINYFEFYEMPVQFSVDKVLLRQKYLELSKQFHPDYFVNEPEDLRESILYKSTLNNNAYKTLSNDTLRIKYVLELTGEFNEQEKEVLPQDFLLEMMELNEQITEADSKNVTALRTTIKQIEERLQNAIFSDCELFDKESNRDVLHRIKTNYLKQKYLLRIKESMLKFAAL